MKKPPFVFLLVLPVILSLNACSNEDINAPNPDDDARNVLITTAQAVIADLPIWLETVGQLHSLY